MKTEENMMNRAAAAISDLNQEFERVAKVVGGLVPETANDIVQAPLQVRPTNVLVYDNELSTLGPLSGATRMNPHEILRDLSKRSII